MNLILSKSKHVKYYTYLDPMFNEIPELRHYVYFISNLEYNSCNDPKLPSNFYFNSKHTVHYCEPMIKWDLP